MNIFYLSINNQIKQKFIDYSYFPTNIAAALPVFRTIYLKCNGLLFYKKWLTNKYQSAM